MHREDGSISFCAPIGRFTDSVVGSQEGKTLSGQEHTMPKSLARKKPARKMSKADRVLRDSFTMPSSDYALIARIRQRCMKLGIGVNKSEILRIGLQALDAMNEKQLDAVVKGLSRVKPGRPTNVDK
jgi:hypothetical protein